MSPSARPRVLLVSYTSEWTGPTRSLLLLLPQLRERFDVGVLHIGRGPLGDELDDRSVPHWSVPKMDKWSVPRLAGLLKREEIDLVYANATHGSARNAFFASRLAGAAFVCHVRAMGWDHGWWKLGFLRWADAVVAVSEACAASVARFVRPERLHVVYNGIPESFGGPAPEGSREVVRGALGVLPEEVLLLSLAHLNERKGQLHAVRALSSLPDRGPRAVLCLAGRLDREPDYVERIRQYVAEQQLEDRVRMVGFRTDVTSLAAAADVFVHTALADPHPRAVLEAMACGLPVVAFDVDGVAETVEDGVTGRLVSVADDEALASALAGLVESPEERERMGTSGSRLVREQFSAGCTARRISGILQAVLSGTESAGNYVG